MHSVPWRLVTWRRQEPREQTPYYWPNFPAYCVSASTGISRYHPSRCIHTLCVFQHVLHDAHINNDTSRSTVHMQRDVCIKRCHVTSNNHACSWSAGFHFSQIIQRFFFGLAFNQCKVQLLCKTEGGNRLYLTHVNHVVSIMHLFVT